MTEWILSSTVLMLIVIGLRTALKGRVSLRLQYALWLLVLVRLLVPVHFSESPLSILNAAQSPVVQAVADIADYRPPVRSFDEAYAEVVARYEAGGVDVDALTGNDLEALDYEAYDLMKADRSIGNVVADALKMVWLAGIAVTALCLLGSNLRFARQLRRSRREIPAAGCPLKVYVTGAVDTPCLFGLLKPAIYLPADTPWDETAMGHILTHELTHYRHGDHIWSILRCVCLALHWYNPLVWVCANLSRRDGELACDEASIRTLGEDQRTAYGRTLIGMTCQNCPGLVGLTATTMNDSAKSLKERIRLIARHPKTAAYTLVLVILIAALAVGCTFTAAPEETTEIPEEVTEPAAEATTEPVITEALDGPDSLLETTWRQPDEISIYPFTDAEIAEAVAVVEAVMEGFEYSYTIEDIAFDPLTTDHWVLAEYADAPTAGMTLEDYFACRISMTVTYSAVSGNESTFMADMEAGRIEFGLMRSSPDGSWTCMRHGTPVSDYPSLLLDAEKREALGNVGGEIVAAYRSNDGVNDYWLYIRDPLTGEIRYTAK